ncbi:MAG TPA: bifunctional diaminohydroxyphosphoribosylaminopyrimidine deaminase/5-amino-6-(5-phosphoribosylamino)uracil reductase RibD, partial [Candidatus Cybelea sp.]
MESLRRQLTPLDALYLQRSYELAARGIGNTSPNPPAGALVVRDGRVVGEGYHRRAGVAHAEPQALEQAGSNARGSTVYVSLEPCRHVGRTPPCTTALIEAGVARVVAGTLDPTDHGGADQLRKAGIEFAVAEDPAARRLIEIF